ncbi:MAG: hypothetical protein COS42_10220 [Flavobacteriales bacterium CG03_land_8_20_14_0_80_35_15]|nr:MAG: hypothetical protein COS42_10220 [Flavobacteriales bacterium CG03_land_8_20_14_0_80_35_15]
MKKIFFVLAFMLIGTFAFANESQKTTNKKIGIECFLILTDIDSSSNVIVYYANIIIQLTEPDCLDIAWDQSIILSSVTGVDQSTLFHILVRSCWETQGLL